MYILKKLYGLENNVIVSNLSHGQHIEFGRKGNSKMENIRDLICSIHANWIEFNKGWISLRVRLAHVWFVRRCWVGVNYTGFIVMQIAKSLKGCMFGRIGLGTTGFLPWLFCLERMEKTINYWEWSSLWQKILAFLRREYICGISKSQVVRVGSTSRNTALNKYWSYWSLASHSILILYLEAT